MLIEAATQSILGHEPLVMLPSYVTSFSPVLFAPADEEGVLYLLHAMCSLLHIAAQPANQKTKTSSL